MRLAIVHDFLNQYGGAERTLEAMHRAFPDAPIYTTIYDLNAMPAPFDRMDIRTSFLQRFPYVFEKFRHFLPFYPRAIESLDLTEFDAVLSSSSAFAKGCRVPKGVPHLCYCYTPMRFAWDTDRYLAGEPIGPLGRLALAPMLSRLRRWDLASNPGVTRFLAISGAVAERIRRLYGRQADVVYPPVETRYWRKLSKRPESAAALDALLPAGFPRKNFLLVVSRLRAYKRVDLAVHAARQLDLPLVVIGDGVERLALQRAAGRATVFLGRTSDTVVAAAYARATALLFPGEEDFGLVPVEAMAAGCPVVAYAAGGALETVTKETGAFFRDASAESLVAAVQQILARPPKMSALTRRAAAFDASVFRSKLSAALPALAYRRKNIRSVQSAK